MEVITEKQLFEALWPKAIMLIHNNEGEVVQSVALSPSLGFYNLK